MRGFYEYLLLDILPTPSLMLPHFRHGRLAPDAQLYVHGRVKFRRNFLFIISEVDDSLRFSTKRGKNKLAIT